MRAAIFYCTTDQYFGRACGFVTGGASRLRETCNGVCGYAARHSMNQSGSAESTRPAARSSRTVTSVSQKSDMSVFGVAPVEITASPCIGQESESCSENVRRRSRSTCGYSLVSFATFEACARHFRCSFNPDISLHCAHRLDEPLSLRPSAEPVHGTKTGRLRCEVVRDQP
jgi:hypothetical protein